VTPYERVQQSRALTAATFPFPDLRSCIDYAICEFAGEYRDAVLRDERTGDKRNTCRTHDARAELGDSLYMLLSACIMAEHEPVDRPIVAWTYRRRCNEIVRHLTHAADNAARLDGETTSHDDAMDYVQRSLDAAYADMIALAAINHGWDADMIVEDACQKFERKHAPVGVR